MQTSTSQILEAALKADSTITTATRRAILRLCKDGQPDEPVVNGNGHLPRVYSREEAGKLLGGRTPRFIDQLAKRGLLQKFVPKGNVRAIGITSDSLQKFISGNT